MAVSLINIRARQGIGRDNNIQALRSSSAAVFGIGEPKHGALRQRCPDRTGRGAAASRTGRGTERNTRGITLKEAPGKSPGRSGWPHNFEVCYAVPSLL